MSLASVTLPKSLDSLVLNTKGLLFPTWFPANFQKLSGDLGVGRRNLIAVQKRR